MAGSWREVAEMWQKKYDEYNSFQRIVGQWGDELFGVGQKAPGIVAHLRKEVEELAEFHAPEEGADCFLLLLQHAHQCGYDLYEEAKKKHQINLTRKWGAPDKDGCIEHIG